DAGVFATANVTKRMGFRDCYAICQNVNFLKQAERGSRFFDCRVFVQPPKEWDTKEDLIQKRLRTGHFSMDKKKMPGITMASGIYYEKGIGGAYGGTLYDAVKHAASFVKNHRHEFLIMRFSHTGNGQLVQEALAKWFQTTELKDRVYKGTGNVANKEIG